VPPSLRTAGSPSAGRQSVRPIAYIYTNGRSGDLAVVGRRIQVDYGRYFLVDAETSRLVLSGEWGVDLDDVEERLTST
jgi:hypothetical protein